jgi:hypothetical protein
MYPISSGGWLEGVCYKFDGADNFPQKQVFKYIRVRYPTVSDTMEQFIVRDLA